MNWATISPAGVVPTRRCKRSLPSDISATRGHCLNTQALRRVLVDVDVDFDHLEAEGRRRFRHLEPLRATRPRPLCDEMQDDRHPARMPEGSAAGEDDLERAGVGGAGEDVVGLLELVEGEVVGDEPGRRRAGGLWARRSSVGVE